MGIAKTQFQVDEYTRLEEEETLIGKRTVFFANQLNFGVKLPWVRTVEIRNFTQDSTKNTSLGDHFRFVIFSLFQFVSFRNV